MDEVEHIDVPGIQDKRRVVGKGEIESLKYEILETDEEEIGIEDIERIETFIKIVKVCGSPKVLQKAIKQPSTQTRTTYVNGLRKIVQP